MDHARCAVDAAHRRLRPLSRRAPLRDHPRQLPPLPCRPALAQPRRQGKVVLSAGPGNRRNMPSPPPERANQGLPDAACLPAAGAELAAVDDAVVLVAGGAEHRRAGHAAVADLAIEEIADRAALIE